MIWYTYKSDGTPTWFMSDLKPMHFGVWISNLNKVTWNQSTQSTNIEPIGEVKFEMYDNKTMKYSWQLNAEYGYRSGSEYMVQFFGNGGPTGLWYEPALSGWGLSVDYQSNASPNNTVVTAYLYDGSEPVWSQGVASGTCLLYTSPSPRDS